MTEEERQTAILEAVEWCRRERADARRAVAMFDKGVSSLRGAPGHVQDMTRRDRAAEVRRIHLLTQRIKTYGVVEDPSAGRVY